MTPIIRIVTAAIRANPAIAMAVAFEVGILLTRAIKQAAGNSPVGKSAKSLEKTLVAAYKPVSQKPTTRRTRRKQ